MLKSLDEYQDERYKNLLTLPNDGDSVDVIFMYRSIKDVMVADAAHYIKSNEYTGYVYCCGKNCPACAKNIRVQSKIFVPVYDIEAGQLKFWDRSVRFQNQLNQDVLSKYPNPSEVIFRITRHGISGDINTTYSISPIGNNLPPKDDEDKGKFYKSYSDILAEAHATFPEYYNEVCKEYTSAELYNILDSGGTNGGGSSNYGSYGGGYSAINNYQVTPRGQSYSSLPFDDDNDDDDDFMNIPEDSDDEAKF